MIGTVIISNGSKWAGQAPDTIEDLLKVLAENTLDSTFEDYGNFVYTDEDAAPGLTCFFGNFQNLSHVFNIRTDDAEVIAKLTSAIRANQQRPDYSGKRFEFPGKRKEMSIGQWCSKLIAERVD